MNKHRIRILQILGETGKEMYGIDIVRLDETRTLGMGSIYTHLFYLESYAGLIESRKEELGRLPRRLYKITTSGRRKLIELKEWTYPSGGPNART